MRLCLVANMKENFELAKHVNLYYLASHLLADLDALPGEARRDAGKVLGQGCIVDGLPARIQGAQRVMRRLGRGGLERGAMRGLHVRVVGLVRPVDGVDGVEHGDVNDRHVAG